MRIAKADLEQAKLDLEFTEVKAPFTGRVSDKRIDVGNLVNGDATLLTTLVSTTPIEFYFEVTETDMLNYLRARKEGDAAQDIAKGYPVYLQLQDENDFTHEGKVNFLDNELSPDTGTMQVRAVFDNGATIFEPGMFARLRVANGKPEQKILIPQDVVGTEQTRKYVYVVDSNNKAVRKYVTLGSITDDGMQIIHGGLSLDDLIIAGGLQMVQPGATVVPMDAVAMEQTQAQQQEQQPGAEAGEAN